MTPLSTENRAFFHAFLLLLVLACLCFSAPAMAAKKGQVRGLPYDHFSADVQQNFTTVSKWPKRTLRYGFVNGTADIIGDGEKQAVREAFALWSNSTPLTFIEVEPSVAEIKISWVTGSHGDNTPFDGTTGELAHAFHPTDGRIHFDEDEQWTLSTRSDWLQPIDLITIAAHEIGHAIGVGHSSDPNALMYYLYTKSHRYLGGDDINAATALYGPEARWHLRNTNAAGTDDVNFVYGAPYVPPAPSDWNNDGTDTPGIYDPGNCMWFLRNSNTAGAGEVNFCYGGGRETLPVAGDWNGDGIDTIGIYVPSTGYWHLRNSNTAGAGDVNFIYGGGLTQPVAGDWNGNGIDTIGIYDPSNCMWYLRNTNTAGAGEINFCYGGDKGTKGIAGDWNGDGKDTVGFTY